MPEVITIDEGAMFGDRVVAPMGSDAATGAVQGPVIPRFNRPIGYGSDDEHRNSPLEETLEHMLDQKGR